MYFSVSLGFRGKQSLWWCRHLRNCMFLIWCTRRSGVKTWWFTSAFIVFLFSGCDCRKYISCDASEQSSDIGLEGEWCPDWMLDCKCAAGEACWRDWVGGEMISRKVEEDGALRCVITEITFKRAQRKISCPGHTSPTRPGACHQNAGSSASFGSTCY